MILILYNHGMKLRNEQLGLCMLVFSTLRLKKTYYYVQLYLYQGMPNIGLALSLCFCTKDSARKTQSIENICRVMGYEPEGRTVNQMIYLISSQDWQYLQILTSHIEKHCTTLTNIHTKKSLKSFIAKKMVHVNVNNKTIQDKTKI